MNRFKHGLGRAAAVLMVCLGVWMLVRQDRISDRDRLDLHGEIAKATAGRAHLRDRQDDLERRVDAQGDAIQQKLDKILDAIETMKASRPADHDADPDPPGAVDEIPIERKEP